MFFGCSGYSASIWHKYPGKWYHCSRTVTGCWSRYKQSCVGGVLLEESGKPVRFYWLFLHQQLFLFFIYFILLPCNKQIRPCSFSVQSCTCICNILQLFRECRTQWCCVRLTITLWIMFTIVFSRFDEKLPLVLQSAAILIKFLYNMVLDTFDRYKYTHTLLHISIKKKLYCENCSMSQHFPNLIKIYSDLLCWVIFKRLKNGNTCMYRFKVYIFWNKIYSRFILCGLFLDRQLVSRFRPTRQLWRDSPWFRRRRNLAHCHSSVRAQGASHSQWTFSVTWLLYTRGPSCPFYTCYLLQS